MRLFILILAGFLVISGGIDYVFSHPSPTSAALIAQLPVDDFSIPLSPTPIWPFAGQVIPESRQQEKDEDDGNDFCLDVPVIMYHHIQPLSEAQKLGHAALTVDSAVFDSQMKYIADQGYTTISAEDLVIALQNRSELPPKPIVITLDDGYVDNYTYAFMMAKKYNLVMNFMISTELVGKPDYMTWDHLEEMAQNPLVRIYNHTASHAALGLISRREIESELVRSNDELRSRLGLVVTVFAYPYGSYSLIAIDTLYKNGFSGAYTTMPGRKQCESDIMLLHRDHIGNAPLTEYGL